jgi:two-component system, OmpR family, phosphate regulon sensor histidine kinase PhoR
MNKLRWLATLISIAIIIIVGFQVYWLRDNYIREKRSLEIRTNILFRETLRHVQDSVLGLKIQNVFTKDAVAIGGTGTTKPPRQNKNTETISPGRVIEALGKTMLRDSLRIPNQQQKGVIIRVQNQSTFRNTDSAAGSLSLDSINPEDIKEVTILKGAAAQRNRLLFSRQNDSVKEPKVSITSVNVKTSASDSAKKNLKMANTITFTNDNGDMIYIKMDSLLADTVSATLLKESFAKKLIEEKVNVPFSIVKNKPATDSLPKEEMMPPFNPFVNASGYQLQLGNTFSYLLKKITLPILFSFFLVAVTMLSFVLLYRSLLRQQRLAQLKNELVSNITHELKTPIATVGVAIEALKNFNALNDPAKTKEYLDISQNELQRLGLLVDKVLKLSMFENKDIDIKVETVDIAALVNEVMNSLRLQIEKQDARISLQTAGDLSLQGDKLHLLSVVFNLLDNALKYSKSNASIQVEIKEEEGFVHLSVTDNGIGIPAAYTGKVFEKFFRVPAGDTHNAKGHGLGLSYVAKVVEQHHGTIEVVSQEGLGSTFTIRLPKNKKA